MAEWLPVRSVFWKASSVHFLLSLFQHKLRFVVCTLDSARPDWQNLVGKGYLLRWMRSSKQLLVTLLLDGVLKTEGDGCGLQLCPGQQLGFGEGSRTHRAKVEGRRLRLWKSPFRGMIVRPLCVRSERRLQ